MGKGSKKPQMDDCAETPISSMIDVVFLLIIFFVVTAAVDKEIEDEKIILSEAPNGRPATTKIANPFVINVHQDGSMKIGLEDIKKGDQDKITQRLNSLILDEKAKGRNPEEINVIIRGDYNAQHGYIKQAMDAVTNTRLLYSVKLNAMRSE